MAYLGPAPANSIIATSDIEDDAVTAAKIAANAVDSSEIAAGAVDLAHMSSESVDEDNLHISNSGSNGQFLSKQSGDSGGLTWAAAEQFANWSQSSGHLTPDNATYGIHLGVATATASNLLDDYEEGTWTPVFVGATTAGSPTSPAASGWYTKIGNHVHLDFQLYTTDKDTAAGSLRIDGIPFTMNSHSAYRCGGSLGNMHNINFAAGDLQINLYGGSSYTYIYPVFHQDSAGSTVLDVGDFINGGWFMGSISYTV